MKRVLAAVVATTVLVAIVLGAPVALWSWGRLDALRGIDWGQALVVPDDGRLLLGVLTVVGWLAWGVLTVSIVVEAFEVVDRARAERLRRPHRPLAWPGLDWPRTVVRGLVITALTGLLGLGLPRLQAPVQAVGVSAVVRSPQPAAPSEALWSATEEAGPATAPQSEPAARSSLHVVEPGEDLRSIAATYYGDPAQWRRIADANQDLVSDPDRLEVGWRLVIPGIAPADGTSVIVVARGDSLWRLAEEYLGAGDRWRDIFEANRDVISDPDLLYRGWRLRVPLEVPPPTQTAEVVAGLHETELDVPPEPPRTTVVAAPLPDREDTTDVVPAAPVGEEAGLSASQALALGVLGTVGAGLAAGVIATVRRRRDLQLAVRPVGRRVVFPGGDALRVESALAVLGTASDNAVPEAPRGPRAMVTAGFTNLGPLRLDLDGHRLVTLDLDDRQATWGTACAWALELACPPGMTEDAGGQVSGATVVATGALGDALAAAALDLVVTLPTVDLMLKDLITVSSRQRAELAARGWSLDQARADADARDAWWPRAYVFPDLSVEQLVQVREALLEGEPTAVVAIVLGGSRPLGATTLTGTLDRARLDPPGIVLRPVSLDAVAAAGAVELLGASGDTETAPAPWFAPGGPDNVLPLTRLTSLKEVDVGDDSPGVTDFSHPTLMLLGPIQLLGATGTPPVRAERSCIEYCAWLVEHPGATASQMASALLVAEGTRRSNVSRLRTWLGTTDTGAPYLPEGYSGRLYLDIAIGSDWQRLRALISPGVNRVPIATLVAALKLVRGAPLADAAPGQWHWAEELRTEMVSTIRDIGAVVGEAALAEGDLDLARWAVARSLVAAPGDEILLRLRLRTEHLAGNRSDVERLVLQLTRQARILGVDLDDETVRAIQEAIEGQPRARA